MFYAYSVFSTITLEPIIRSNWNSNLFCILWYLTNVQRLNTILCRALVHSQVIIWKPSRDRQTDGRTHTLQTKQNISHDTWPLSVARYKNHQSFDRHPTTKTQMNKNKNGQDNHQTFPDFGQYMVPRAEQIMLTLPEHLVILPVFVGVHTASALFFWRSCSILFICFVLVISIVSFCVISVWPCFWIYDPSSCCFGIRLPIFLWQWP
jgi:hypothetical protein